MVQGKNDLQFTYDLIPTIMLFLIFVFYRLNEQREAGSKNKEMPLQIVKFSKMKKIIAVFLIPILLLPALFSHGRWLYKSCLSLSWMVNSLTDIKHIFFADFFTIKIMIDVLQLLSSFLHTDKFSKVMRNSGFTVSTIPLKLSSGAEGLLNIILIVGAVLFGVTILGIHNHYEKLDVDINILKYFAAGDLKSLIAAYISTSSICAFCSLPE